MPGKDRAVFGQVVQRQQVRHADLVSLNHCPQRLSWLHDVDHRAVRIGGGAGDRLDEGLECVGGARGRGGWPTRRGGCLGGCAANHMPKVDHIDRHPRPIQRDPGAKLVVPGGEHVVHVGSIVPADVNAVAHRQPGTARPVFCDCHGCAFAIARRDRPILGCAAALARVTARVAGGDPVGMVLGGLHQIAVDREGRQAVGGTQGVDALVHLIRRARLRFYAGGEAEQEQA